MKIGIDVTNFFSGLTNGTPIYLYNLVRALPQIAPEIELYLLYNHRRNRVSDGILEELSGPRVHVRRTTFAGDRIPAGGWWFPLHPPISRLLSDIDVFHAGDFVRPRPDGTPIVGSVLDLTTQLFPEYHTGANRWRDGMKLRWLQAAATRVIAISESTKRDYVRVTGTDPSRVDVAPLARGVSLPSTPAELRERLRNVQESHRLPDRPFILSVGTIEPRKNHLRLIRAFESLPAEVAQNFHLVLAGGRGWKAGAVSEALADSPARDRIHHLGFVSAENLVALYAHAHLFAYPSLYEGFGLPVLEAMSHGTPVLTSDRSSLPEVAGDAAVLVDPFSVEAIRDGLLKLLTDRALHARLSRDGIRRAHDFTWRRTAELTMESYERARNARLSALRPHHVCA